VNCLLVGRPTGTTLDIAGALLAADPEAPVTLLSDDTEGLLDVLDRPGLTRCEVLWADAASPATVDDALVHRRMLHGPPDVVVIVVDEPSDSACAFATVLAPRLSGAPLVVTGHRAASVGSEVVALLPDAADEAGLAPRSLGIVAGHDPRAVLDRAAQLVREAPAPKAEPSGPLLHGHCAAH
jgi:hypothetical protein